LWEIVDSSKYKLR
jgi:WD40 repeat protein